MFGEAALAKLAIFLATGVPAVLFADVRGVAGDVALFGAVLTTTALVYKVFVRPFLRMVDNVESIPTMAALQEQQTVRLHRIEQHLGIDADE